MSYGSDSGERRSMLPAMIASLLVFAGTICAVVISVGLRLSSPTSAAIGPPPVELAAAETVEFPSRSGSNLHGWWVPGRPGGGAIVLMQGIWSNRLTMVERARVLSQLGASVLLFDFQGQGESPGRHVTFGYLEGLDAAAAVAFVHARAPDEKIGAIGVSLGGAAALLGPKPLPVQALVLESVYPDIGSALSSRLRIGLGSIAGPILTPMLQPLFEFLLPTTLSVTPDQLRPIDHIGASTAPLLIVSGTADDRTPIAQARSLYEQAPGPKQFWPVRGAGHVDLERYGPEEYWGVVLPFLARSLKADWAVEARKAHNG